MMRNLKPKPKNRRKGIAEPVHEPMDLSSLKGPLSALVAGLVIVGALVAGLVWLDQPIRSVVLEGAFESVSREAVEDAVVPAISGGLLTVDIDRLRSSVATIPWVDRVQISRRWPATLQVEISEQVAAARWGDGLLLNTRGELFDPAGRDPGRRLPQLAGPEGSHPLVVQRYLSVRGDLAQRGLAVRAISVDERRAWSLTLSDGREVRLGRSETRDRLDRLVQVVLPILAEEQRPASYIDLRYTNGFAVGWEQLETDPVDLKADSDVQES